MTFDLEHTMDAGTSGTIVCKFGGDPAISVVEEAICAKKFTDRRTDRQTDRRTTDDGRRAIALAHELIITVYVLHGRKKRIKLFVYKLIAKQLVRSV